MFLSLILYIAMIQLFKATIIGGDTTQKNRTLSSLFQELYIILATLSKISLCLLTFWQLKLLTVCLLSHDNMVFSGPNPNNLLNKICFFYQPTICGRFPSLQWTWSCIYMSRIQRGLGTLKVPVSICCYKNMIKTMSHQ